MKKKLVLIVSLLLMTTLLAMLFVGCKSDAEKEKEYYEESIASVKENSQKLTELMDKAFGRAWSSSFVYAYTYYEKEITRGSKEVAGWPDDNKQMVKFMAFDVNYTDSQNYTIKTIVFKDTDRDNYVKNITSKKYREKFTLEKTLEYKVENGNATGELNEGFNPIEYMLLNTNEEYLNANPLSASDNFRIYLNDSFKLSNHFMRIESRAVYDAEGNVINIEANNASEKNYWSGYGEDISYNWDNVYGMDNNRLTVLYTKGSKTIDSLEIYNEKILAYYTQNNQVDKSLVLKADVVAFEEMVVEFNYK